MKKLILLLLFIPLVFSCSNSSEDDELDCDCYIVEGRPISCEDGDGNPNTHHTYCLDVRNVCTNEMEFDVHVTSNYWTNKSGLGSTICDLKSNRLN
jgi:hypothetical protein